MLNVSSLSICWLEESGPEVVCLNELKALQEKFSLEAIQSAGYYAIWHGQLSLNGVAILSRELLISEIKRGLSGDPEDLDRLYEEIKPIYLSIFEA